MLALGIKQQIDSLTDMMPFYFLVERKLPVVKKKVASISKYDWKMLLKCGINEKDSFGNTALHYACEAQSVHMLNALSSNKMCNFELRNNADQLPLTVAQETGNRSFYLRVLIKFFESKDNQHLANYYKTVLKNGAIDMRPVKCILTGPPGAGKTTLKMRLLGNKASRCAISTGVAESPQVVAVRDVSRVHASVSFSSKEWTPVDCRDQVEALLQTVSSNIHNAIESISTSNESSLILIPDKLSPKVSLQFKSGPDSFGSIGQFKSKFKLWEKEQVKSDNMVKAKRHFKNFEYQLKELRKLVNSVPSKKSKSDPQKFKVENLSVNPFLRIVDTGGQPELHELLPAFVTGPAINLIVFNLEYDLRKHFPVFFRAAKGKESLYIKSSLNHEETILRSLSSIACLGHTHQSGSLNNAESISFLIGSHRDLVEDKKVNSINQDLRSVIEASNIYRNDLIKYHSEDSILYAVNGLDPSCEVLETLREDIFKAIQETFDPIPVPVSWLILSVKLEVLLEKKLIQSVISIDKCFEIAQTCGILTIDQLENNVLWFFHNIMGSVLYYSGIPELRSKIILDSQSVFNIVTELLTSCFLFSTIGSKLASEDFSKHGYFTEKSLRKVIKEKSDIIPFSASELIALLRHLYVIVSIGADKYFMPTALKPAELPCSFADIFTSPPPLIVHFECGYSPVGVFTSLVAKLLSDGSECKLFTDFQQHRNAILFCIGLHCSQVMLVAKACHFEILFEPSQDSCQSYPIVKICQEIRTLIDNGISAVIKSLHYKFHSKHYFGFICTEERCAAHPVHATIVSDESLAVKQAKCPQADCLIPLSNQQLLWYGIQEDCPQASASTNSLCENMTEELFNTQLSIVDLGDVMDMLCDLVKWKQLGLQLGLSFSTLNKIEVDKIGVDSQSMEMLGSWLSKLDQVESKGGPTWKQLVSALRKVKEFEIADKVLKELKEQLSPSVVH